MPKWVPPIPTEKLYSPPAMSLGAGLALLVWCYDGVERDGTVEIDLRAATGALGRPYRTIKEWWRLLRDGPFFSDIRDRGRLGFVATFDREWIEWRVMEANYPTANDAQGQTVAPEPPLIDAQVPLKAASRPDERHPTALEDPAYKVLISTDQACDLVASDDATARTKKPRKPKPDKPPDQPSEHQRLMAAYAQALGYAIPNGAKEAAGAKKLLAAGYTVDQVLDVYRRLKGDKFWTDKHVSLHNVFQQIGAVLTAKNGAGYDQLGSHSAASNGVVRSAGSGDTGAPRASPERGPLRPARRDW